MNALEFVRKRNRMCRSFIGRCDDCPADKINCCDTFDWNEEIVSIVDKWSKENPRKTRQSEFLKLFPEANVDGDGCLTLIPCQFYQNMYSECDNRYKCAECRRKFWNQEVE